MISRKPKPSTQKISPNKCLTNKDPCTWCNLATSEERERIFNNQKYYDDVHPLDYTFTFEEGLANVLTHAICIIPAIVAWYRIQSVADDPREYLVCFLYGTGLIALFLTSTVYHFVFFLEQTHSCRTLSHKLRPIRRFLSLLDRAVIFIFIAGSYTPWLVLKDTGWIGPFICKAIWVTALFGWVYHRTPLHTMYPKLEALIYAIVAVIPGMVVIYTKDVNGLILLLTGFLSYIVGLVFYLNDGIRYNHAAWHLFVNSGAFCHYLSLYNEKFVNNWK
ncbi:hypothetical protein QR680_004949 [Steinernema hermaphroditum]|uniref:Uncharacterized protein n=1 Tax=Steinernema hermaphroditum TaxID=289476 RepID=A0AA39HQC1_9BILA|nr:hypothetical protein QR680_004949 [Steinernema hermaphroditum]